MHNKSIAQVILILSPSIVLVALGMDIIIPCIPAIAQSFAVQTSLVQWVLSIYFIGTGVGQIIIGPLADLFGRRKVILSSIALFVLSSLACSYAADIKQLIIGRLFQGISACGATVVVMAVIRDLYDDNSTPKAYSYVNSVTAMAPILAPLLGGYFLLWFHSWQASFDFVAGFGILAFIINLIFLKETKPEIIKRTSVLQDFKEILRDLEFLGYTLCAISGLASLFLFFSISPILMIDKLSMAPSIYGYYFGFNFIIYLFGNIASPRLQNKYPVDKVIALGAVYMLAGAILMWYLEYINGLSIVAIMLPAIIISFGVGLSYGPCMAQAMRHFRHIAGTASACYGALLYCISALIIVIVMQFRIHNTVPYAIAVLVLSIIALFVCWLLNNEVNHARSK